MLRGGIFKVNSNFFLNQKEKTEQTKWEKEAPKCLLDDKLFPVIPVNYFTHTFTSSKEDCYLSATVFPPFTCFKTSCNAWLLLSSHLFKNYNIVVCCFYQL